MAGPQQRQSPARAAVERAGGSLVEARAVSRLEALRVGKRHYDDRVWPGLDAPMKIRVLTCSEIQECHAHAVVRFADLNLPIDALTTVGLFEDECLSQILFRACRDPEDPEQPLARDAADLRDNTTIDQRAQVYAWYRDLQTMVDPDPNELTVEDTKAIIEAQKKRDENLLVGFGSRKLASFIASTAPQPES
ncbi:MAG: hypothetical protein ACEQSX_03610 [Baekduiaceae bacterium]